MERSHERVCEEHSSGSDLGQKRPAITILAAAFTFLSTWLTNKAAKDRSAMLLVMISCFNLYFLVLELNFFRGTLLGDFKRLPSYSDFGF